MDRAQTLTFIAGLLKESGHPDIVDATAKEKAVAVTLASGAANYVLIPHVQPASARTPDRPSWPGYTTPSPAPARERTAR